MARRTRALRAAEGESLARARPRGLRLGDRIGPGRNLMPARCRQETECAICVFV